MKNTLNFVPVLQDLVQGYNRSYHRSIKRAPTQVTQANRSEVWETLYGKKGNWKKPRFKLGDRVRLNEKFRQFKKGYLPSWTEEVFVVRRYKRGKCRRIKWINGTLRRSKERSSEGVQHPEGCIKEASSCPHDQNDPTIGGYRTYSEARRGGDAS